MDRYFVIPWAAWRERFFNWKYKKGAASITSKQMQPQWEVQSNSRVVVDYLGTVDRLIKEGEICLEKRCSDKWGADCARNGGKNIPRFMEKRGRRHRGFLVITGGPGEEVRVRWVASGMYALPAFWPVRITDSARERGART